jgi:hypothetical protein
MVLTILLGMLISGVVLMSILNAIVADTRKQALRAILIAIGALALWFCLSATGVVQEVTISDNPMTHSDN